jgi:glycosyltransferase involved in cell wall biosynthesis
MGRRGPSLRCYNPGRRHGDIMRILLATDSFDPALGGVQRVVRDLADTLSSGGHEVVVLTPRSPGLEETEVLSGVRVERLRLGRPAFRLRALLGFARRRGAARSRVRALLEEFRPEVVHLHFLQSPLSWILPSLCIAMGIPIVATAHGRDVTGSMVDDDRLGRRAVRRVLDGAAVVTAPSEATLETARMLAPKPLRARYEVVPNNLPVDMEKLLDVPSAPPGKGIVAVGELTPKKGFDLLVRAVGNLDRVTLRIAGEGEERPRLEALITELDLADRVALVGVVDRAALPDFLRSACVQCVPSRREPFGLVLLEGFACGVPVVAHRVDGIPEVTGEEGAALLVPPEDVPALTAALRRVLADDDLREGMIDKGRERARLHSRERTTDLYLGLYRDATA